MSMVTSCPACATTFRVAQDQLRVRQGRVRCGKCAEVFDAFKTLASYPDEPLPVAPTVYGRETYDSAPSEPVPQQPMLDIGPGFGFSVPLRPPDRARANFALLFGHRYLAATAACLGVALMLQLSYAMRAPLANGLPVLRPLFERICAIVGCSVPLPRRTEVLAIESSDLQADAKRSGVIVLTAALRNRGTMPVEFPALELTLTNAQDQALARRIFLPKDYLQRADAASAGMRPSAEISVRLELDTGDLKAAGYRLFLFYP